MSFVCLLYLMIDSCSYCLRPCLIYQTKLPAAHACVWRLWLERPLVDSNGRHESQSGTLGHNPHFCPRSTFAFPPRRWASSTRCIRDRVDYEALAYIELITLCDSRLQEKRRGPPGMATVPFLV